MIFVDQFAESGYALAQKLTECKSALKYHVVRRRTLSDRDRNLAASARAATVAWVHQLMEKRRWTGSELARNAGLTPSTVLRLLNDPAHRFVPSLRTLQKISVASGHPIPRKVLDAIGAARSDASQQRGLADQEVSQLREAGKAVRLRHISSRPTGLQAERGEVLVSCPPQLDGDDTAFACYMPDEALEPWVKSGSLLFGTNRRDPIKDDLVLMTDDQGRSRVRLLVQHAGRSMTIMAASRVPETVSLDALKEVAVISVIVRS